MVVVDSIVSLSSETSFADWETGGLRSRRLPCCRSRSRREAVRCVFLYISVVCRLLSSFCLVHGLNPICVLSVCISVLLHLYGCNHLFVRLFCELYLYVFRLFIYLFIYFSTDIDNIDNTSNTNKNNKMPAKDRKAPEGTLTSTLINTI